MSPVVFGSLAALNGAVVAQVGYALTEYWSRHEDNEQDSDGGPDASSHGRSAGAPRSVRHLEQRKRSGRAG